MEKDHYYMQKAIEQALKTKRTGDVPIGCIIIKDNKIIGCGYNQKEKKHDVTSHAEIEAIRQACKKLKSWHLDGCTMYVTMEPCTMCGAAILQARMDRLVYGTSSDKNGCFGGYYSLNSILTVDKNIEIVGGVDKTECSKLVTMFFQEKRKSKV